MIQDICIRTIDDVLKSSNQNKKENSHNQIYHHIIYYYLLRGGKYARRNKMQQKHYLQKVRNSSFQPPKENCLWINVKSVGDI